MNDLELTERLYKNNLLSFDAFRYIHRELNAEYHAFKERILSTMLCNIKIQVDPDGDIALPKFDLVEPETITIDSLFG